MGPDIAFCSSPGPDDTMALVRAQATQIRMTLVAAQPSDVLIATFSTQPPGTYVVFGGNTGHRHQYRP